MKKILGIFDKRLIIWFHYVLLLGIIVGTYYLSVLLNLMELVQTNPVKGWTYLLILYYLTISIGDQLIHSKYILNVD